MPGYDARTLEPLKTALICPECSLVLRDAVQTGDGVRLCESCFKQLYQYPNHTSPKSRTVVGEEYYPDKAVRREILQLLVLCMYLNYGCPWQGQLQHFEDHCQDCRYKPMRCPNPGCNELMPADKLDSHVDEECGFRTVACDYCRELTTANQLEEHQNRCPKVPVECERCSERVVRDELKEHQLRDCPLVQYPDLEGNGGEQEHNSELEDHQLQDCPFVECPGCKEIHHCPEFASNHQDVVRSHQELYGPPGPGPPQVPQLQTRRYTDPVMEQDMEQPTTRDSSCRPLRPHDPEPLRTVIEAQFDTGFDHLQPENPNVNGSGSETRIRELEKRVEELFRQQTALRTHTAELEMQLQASLASTHNGSFLWRIPDVSQRRRDAIDERTTSIYSPPFYTGRNGYKMCVRAYLNGDGSGHTTHLSLFFVLMKGEYDPLLKWPFDHKVSMILVDQNHRKHIVQTFKPTPESSSFQRPKTDMNVASGCPQFAKLSVLNNTDYVKDNVLYIKCIVDTSHIFHP